MQNEIPTTKPPVRVAMKPSRSKRTTGWKVTCSECGDIGPRQIATRALARRYAATHGTENHKGEEVAYPGAFDKGGARVTA